jgi:hypothetical protein
MMYVNPENSVEQHGLRPTRTLAQFAHEKLDDAKSETACRLWKIG